MGCLTRMAATFTLLFLLAVPVAAHHVPVPKADTDGEAFAVAQAEWAAQDALFTATWDLYSVTSGAEKADALLTLETLVDVSLGHFEGLDVRDCFRPWHVALMRAWELLPKAVAFLRTGVPLSPAEVALGSSLIDFMKDPAFVTLFTCEGET